MKTGIFGPPLRCCETVPAWRSPPSRTWPELLGYPDESGHGLGSAAGADKDNAGGQQKHNQDAGNDEGQCRREGALVARYEDDREVAERRGSGDEVPLAREIDGG